MSMTMLEVQLALIANEKLYEENRVSQSTYQRVRQVLLAQQAEEEQNDHL
jgi:hypothetical protein